MIGPADLFLFSLALARIATFVAAFPLFSGRQLPNLVKLGLAASLAIFWTSETSATQDITDQFVQNLAISRAVLMWAWEIAMGFVLALALGCFLWPARIAGAYIGQEMGLSMAAQSDPENGSSSTIVNRMLDAFAVLVFFATNLHHFIIITLHLSFSNKSRQVEILRLPIEAIVSLLNSSTERGLQIVGPIVIALMLVTLVVLLLNKAAPTLNLFSIGISLRVSLGIVALLAFSPIFLLALQVFFDRIAQDVETMLGQMVN
ncbi:MAG: flagellar biosynthetic protein FliR [bacterium]|nr:flagellar biosynthetic protein FliR [bacterium]